MKALFDFAVADIKAEADRLCHRNDPDTSRQAAQKMVESGKLQKQEKHVLDWIKYHHNKIDFTARELSGGGSVNYHTIQRRLSGLHRKGKIQRTGEKRNGCAVWRLREC